jgi:hypothetical protein
VNSNTTKLISPERVKALLECYGADANAWPDDERASAQALIQHSDELQALRKQERELDELLLSGNDASAGQAPADSALVARIVDNLPEQKPSAKGARPHASRYRTSALNHPRNWLSLAAAAATVFVISVAIMDLESTSVSQQPAPVTAEMDEWMWEQVTGDPLDDEEEPMTFMSLVEMETS